MNTLLNRADEQTTEPTIIEIIEAVDTPTRLRVRLALISARHSVTQSIHLKPGEFTIASPKEVVEHLREQQSSREPQS